MNLNTISPYVRVALDSKIQPPWKIRERVLFDYEILYVKSGKIIVTVEDEVYYGQPEDLFFFKPKQRHSITFIGDEVVHQPHIHFDFFYEDNSPDVQLSFQPLNKISANQLSWFRPDVTAGLNIPNYIKLTDPVKIENKLLNLIHTFEQKMPYYEINAKGLLINLWVTLLQQLNHYQNEYIVSHWEALQSVKEYLSINLHETANLDHLSKMAKLSKSHFLRLFKLAFHMSPLQYQQAMRMEKAKEMILYSNKSISEIAETFGYSSIHSFSRTFKINQGVSPAYYRRRIYN
ncbi:helix-turn-helix domain-containing protein [Paenibacillus sp. IITD108]|uniref:helix-turn-helix domain-containing protein n=1 Tax=Paenibacillus sp. IITD108 TaxID=3116649 RepID=UPI002F3F1ABA